MVYGAVVRAPVEGSAPAAFDEAKVRAVPGVIRTVMLPYGIGVVAEKPWVRLCRARHHRRKLQPGPRNGKAWGFDSEEGHKAFAAAARDLGKARYRLVQAMAICAGEVARQPQ